MTILKLQAFSAVSQPTSVIMELIKLSYCMVAIILGGCRYNMQNNLEKCSDGHVVSAVGDDIIVLLCVRE